METRFVLFVVTMMVPACVTSQTEGSGKAGAPTSSSSPRGPDGGAPSSPTGEGAASGSVDGTIVGSWYAGRGGTRMSYDPATGAFGPPAGSGMLFVFHADGSYVKAVQSLDSGACTMGFIATESGVATTSGERLLLHPTHGNLHNVSCSGAADTDKSTEVVDEALTWSVGAFSQDPSQAALTLTNETGDTAEFAPAR